LVAAARFSLSAPIMASLDGAIAYLIKDIDVANQEQNASAALQYVILVTVTLSVLILTVVPIAGRSLHRIFDSLASRVSLSNAPCWRVCWRAYSI
jgi:hypothetical protein